MKQRGENLTVLMACCARSTHDLTRQLADHRQLTTVAERTVKDRMTRVPSRLVATTFVQLTMSSHPAHVLTEEYFSDTIIFQDFLTGTGENDRAANEHHCIVRHLECGLGFLLDEYHSFA